MPIYEYKCSHCNETCELIIKIDAHPPACSKCGYSTLVRAVSKGAGFVINGYSEANGYERECINYDGSKPNWSGEV